MHEIDDEPALDMYNKYLKIGDDPALAVDYPLLLIDNISIVNILYEISILLLCLLAICNVSDKENTGTLALISGSTSLDLHRYYRTVFC